jgi:multidrug efflux system membrane fusion protein
VAVLAGLGWLAWSLTHPDKDAQAAGPGGAGGPGGPGGGGRPGGPGGPGGRAPASAVGVAVAERGTIPVNLEALGTVVPLATARVRPQVSGPLLRVLYKEGQMVRKGDLLAEIDPRPFELALQQAIGARMRDEAQLEAARVQLQRYQTLLQQDSIARQDVDTQAATVRQLEAAIVTDKANEGTARLNLAYTRISAPIGGRLGLRTVDPGNIVNPSDANGVAVITQIAPIDVEFSIPQDHAAWLQHNAGAHMEVKAYDRTRTQLLDTGVFQSLDNQIDTQTGTVRAKARFNNARQQMFPSQFVNIQLQIRTINDAVVVPVSAVRQGGQGEYVFVVNQETRTVTLRQVVRGATLTDRVQIAQGLQVGERVVTEGADRLRDGSRVLLPGDIQRAQGGGGFGGRRRDGASAAGAAQGASAPASGSQPQGAQVTPAPGSPFGPSAPNPQDLQRPSRAASSPAAGPPPSMQQQAPAQQRPAAAGGNDLPNAEQRKRILDSAQGDPEQLERRKRFLEALDRGDPAALERWHQMQQRRREAAGGGQ